MADRNTYLKMMLNNGKTQNSSIPDVKDYVANLGLNDEDIADFLIKNNEEYAKQVLSESQQQLQTQEQPLNQEKEEDKNWWQNIVDGMASIGNAVIDGIMNFADDVGDFFISVGDWMMGGNNEWADEAINYDWQAQVTNALNFMQPLLQGGDVVQNYNDWAQSIWQGPETSREYLNGVVEGTWTDNDFGKFLRDAANSIGYMLPTIAVGVLTGGSSAAALSTMGVVAGMGQTSDAYQENNNMGLALLSGIVAGGIEAGTEAIGGFIPGSKTITKTTIKTIGKQMLEEGAEEVVSGFLQPVVDSIAKGNAEPWFDDNGQFVYFSPEFWFTGEDSVARQCALGAFTGGIFGGANIVQNRIKYGKAGQQFGQAYQEFVETRNEARELKSKNKSTDAIEQKLGEASVYLAEKANQLKTAIEDGSISNRQVKNLGMMLHSPTSNRNLLVENLNENINQLNKTTNLDEHILRDLVSDFNISNNSNFKLDIVDDLKDANGNSVNAQFNENTNTISLNSSILDNNAYSVLGHELLAHGVLDNILTNSNTRSLVFNLVNNDTEWVNKNKQAILKEYNTTENSELYKSELVANYLQEKLINNNSLSDLELLASNKGVFKEFVNSAKLIMENTNSSKLKQQIRKAVRQFGKSNYRVNSIVLKMLNDRKLNNKEQEYYNQNKALFDAYFGIINDGLVQETNGELKVAYSKNLNDVVDELIENSDKIETRIESDSQGEYVVYQNLDLSNFNRIERGAILLDYLKQKFTSDYVFNIADDNSTATLTSGGRGKLSSHGSGYAANAKVELENLLKIAKKTEVRKSKKSSQDYNYTTYTSRILIGDTMYTYDIDIKNLNDGNRIYDIKNEKSVPVIASLTNADLRPAGNASSNDNISQNEEDVNTDNKKYSKKLENSNQMEENREYERTNEFRELQEESRKQSFESIREQNSYTTNNEGLRTRLSTILQRQLERAGINSSTFKLLNLNSKHNTTFNIYEKIEPSIFHDVFEIVRKYTPNGELVDLHDNYTGLDCYLSEDGLSGFAIEENGNLVSVFNANRKRGFLDAISQIVKSKASHLDCYASQNQDLRTMYEKTFGFKTASVMDYNMEYDHDDIAKNHNSPQVAFMVNTNQDVETKHFNKDQYDEAQEYQLSFLNNQNSSSIDNRINESPLKDILTNKDIELYNRSKNGEILSKDEILNSDIVKKLTNQNSNTNGYLISKEQSKGNETISNELLARFNNIKEEFENKYKFNETPADGIAVIVLGLPASGKSSTVVNKLDIMKKGSFFNLDNDNIKPFFEEFDNGKGAGYVHEASAYISEQMVLKDIVKNKKNVVVPVIGKGMGTLEMYGKTFHDTGYNRIEIINVKLPLDKSANRNFTRMIETGRNVNFEYLYSVGEKSNINYDIIKERIKNGKELYYTHYGAISTDVAFGESPNRIEDSGTLSLSSMDEERHQSNGEILGRSKMGRYENNSRRDDNSGLPIYSEHISLRNSTKLENYNSDVDIQFLESNKANKVKENANRQLWQKVLNLKDAENSYNSLINYINDKLNIDLDVSNKQDKIRALFDSYNVNEINNTLSDFTKDLLNSKVYQGAKTTLRDVFEANDFDTVKLENAMTKSLKHILDNKAKTSETTKIFNNLQAQLLKAADLINRYKNRARQFASLYKKVENIKKKLKIENNNTKLTDIKLDEVNLLKYLVSGRVFTKDGGISGTWRTRFNDLMKEDVNYFSSLRNSVFNENGELNKAIETFEYLGNSFDLRRKQQRTLNIEEADALIQAFNSVLSAMNDYKNGYYEKVEKLSNDLYSEQSEIIEANKNSSLTVSKINQIISRVSSPLTNLAVFFGGENTHMYKELIGNIENNYERYLFDQSVLNTSLIEKLEAISKKGILTNQTKIIKNFKGIKRLNKWHLYSMWLNLKAESNLARVSEKGFTLKDKVGQVQHIKYDANLLSDIESHLDGVEIEQLQTLLDFYNVEIKDYIKKAQTKIDGFSNVLNSTYYPQITSKSELKGNLTGDEPLFLRDNGQFKNLKARTGVITSLDLVNPLELVRSYIDSASRYSNLTQAERLLNRTLNKNIEVNNDTTSLRKLFKERYGNEFERQLTSFFNKLTGNLNIVSDSLIAKIGGMSSVAMLGFNISTVFKQLGSLPMAGNVIGYRNLISGLRGNARIKKLHNQLYESNGYYRNRVDENGYVFANTMASDVVSKASNIKKKIIDFSLKGMQFMDQYVVLLSYQGAQDYVYRLHNKDINYKPGSELNIKEASKVMNKILLQTQSNAYAISTSMLRSGEMGDLMRYTFGVFGSDNQNKISELYQQFGTIVKQSNYIKALKKKLATDLSQSDKTLYEARLKEAQSNYKNAVKRLTIHSIPNLAIGAVITSLVAVLMKYLLGRDKGEEWDDYLMEFSMDTFVDWIPFVGTIYNAFQYDDGNFSPIPFEQFISLFEVISNCFTKLSSGNLTQREMITQITKLFTALSMTAGIPTKNVTNLIIGITDKFSPQIALNMQSLLYGYSQSYYTRLMKESLERNDYKNYAIYYKTNAELFKVNELDDKVLNKIINLKKIGYDVTLKNVPDTLKDENGEEFTLADKQITKFREIYSLANQSAVNVLEGVRFNKLSSQDQATVLRKVFDAYYDYAKSVVSKTDPTSRAAKVIAMTEGKINISKYISYAQDLLNIEGKDKKEQILKKMKQYYLSDFEKDIVLYLVGYDVDI